MTFKLSRHLTYDLNNDSKLFYSFTGMKTTFINYKDVIENQSPFHVIPSKGKVNM